MLKNAGRNLICGIKPIKLGPMEEILVFQHDPFEDLGVFAEVLERQAAGYRVIRLFDGETPTEDWERIKGLIVLGGP
jgi:hypothetical protein